MNIAIVGTGYVGLVSQQQNTKQSYWGVSHVGFPNFLGNESEQMNVLC